MPPSLPLPLKKRHFGLFMRSLFGSPSNPSSGIGLIPLSNDKYPPDEHVEDMLRRQSRRSGMVLAVDELIGFVHLPSSAICSSALVRQTGKTKAAPKRFTQGPGLFLGENLHL